MKYRKTWKCLLKGRKIFFTLALFILAFAVASVIKIQAGTDDNVSGWMWGGSEEAGDGSINGNETGVGWVSANNTNGGGSVSYGINIPGDGGNLSGYAWSENIGWISFNVADLAGCPSGTCSARRESDNIRGWARISGIKDAAAIGNSGGWQGWISLSGSGYGLRLDTANHKFQDGSYAWSDEMGWINFSHLTYTDPCSPLCGSAISQTLCAGDPAPSSNLCASGTPSAVTGSGPWSWTCSCGGTTTDPCVAYTTPRSDGQCGSADGTTICDDTTPQWCVPANSVDGSPPAVNAYDISWQCEGTCGGSTADCSARGTKACGWIETNP